MKKAKMAQKNPDYKRLIRFLIILVLGFTAAILAVSFPLLTGDEFILETEQVDPFDIFRGQYLILAYPAAHLENTSILASDAGKKVYIGLAVGDDGVARQTGAWLEKPEGNFIAGRVVRDWRGLNAEIGIENYFFERNAEINTTNMQVKVKVDRFGTARIVSLWRNGAPVQIEYE